jgi:hypothetical protein
MFKQQKKSSSLKREHLALDFSSLLWVILAPLDPDPYSQCGLGSGPATLV